MIQRTFLLLASVLCLSTVCAQNSTQLSNVVHAVQNEPSLTHASLSVSVYNITQGKQVYNYDAHRSLTPASLTKIFTTSVAFNLLGDSFRFKTVLSYSGTIDNAGTLHGNLYIIGGGDPMLGSFRYRQTCPDSIFALWYRAIKNIGIKKIDGRICYDATIFDNQLLHDTWQWGDVGNYYGCGASGLNFHENLFFVYFNPGKRQGYLADVDSYAPANIDVRVQNEVTTGPAGSGDRVIVYGDPTSPLRVCRGTVPLGQPHFAVRGALPNPPEACARLFSLYLRKHQVSIANSPTEVFSRQDTLTPIVEYNSNTFYEIAQYTNFTSNNIYAESIFKYLGYMNNGKGSYANGAKAVKDFFKKQGLESSGVHIVDGSGLSRSNRVTADFLCRYLTAVSKMPIYNDFSMTLGKVGESGTVRNLLPDLPKGVTMRMKSGNMDGVCGYAGYVTTASGDLLCFAAICNEFDCTGSQMKSKMTKILYEIGKL